MNKRTTRLAIGGLVAMTLVAAACGSAERARIEAPKATAFLVGHFEKSLASNFGDYIANYDANLQRSGLGHN